MHSEWSLVQYYFCIESPLRLYQYIALKATVYLIVLCNVRPTDLTVMFIQSQTAQAAQKTPIMQLPAN